MHDNVNTDSRICTDRSLEGLHGHSQSVLALTVTLRRILLGVGSTITISSLNALLRHTPEVNISHYVQIPNSHWI